LDAAEVVVIKLHKEKPIVSMENEGVFSAAELARNLINGWIQMKVILLAFW
jgi:hypothetical protein